MTDANRLAIAEVHLGRIKSHLKETYDEVRFGVAKTNFLVYLNNELSQEIEVEVKYTYRKPGHRYKTHAKVYAYIGKGGSVNIVTKGNRYDRVSATDLDSIIRKGTRKANSDTKPKSKGRRHG